MLELEKFKYSLWLQYKYRWWGRIYTELLLE